ncbi:hypothetical protein GCM10011316_28620 [Roseibium aquae]|uniref:OB fold (BOF) protein n=1 Tax=Roseibium aquae TaxID=1323746 RepID=A0A916X2N5_9HYPH|nr:hypothetical protein [Roseibium aquae]GGB54817.1 hypothetical protein GCM10011316_28620 [Roseibium aquae]
MKSLAMALVSLFLLPASVANASNITPIDGLQRGTMVTVQGVVDRIPDEDEFVLRDATGSVEIYVGPNWVPVDVGEQITVEGFVDDGIFIEIYAREIRRANGQTVTIERRYD